MAMKWRLWLDDQMDDPEAPARHCPEGFMGARTSLEAQRLCLMAGPPAFIDFDHDLGDGDDAMVFLKWLFRTYPDHPPQFSVHSANPVAEGNITSYVESWRKSLSL